MTTTMRPEELTENAVVDPHGKKIGKVGTVYLADDTRRPEWVTVQTGMFGHKESFVPLRGAHLESDGLHVDVTKERVSDAPRIENDRHLSEKESAELYRFYDMPMPRATGEDRAQGHDQRAKGDGRRRDDERSMTRSEEQMKVGTERVESGKVKLRKYTVTENEQVTVPVTHEEVRVEREPIRDGDRRGAAIGDDEQEVTLHSERPKVEKETVPRERVRLTTEDVTEEQTVSDEVRKERIEVDDGRRRDR
ncbi:PRC and DUF2382 domain-containing protein [Amycolatopsis sp. K13G38]|uniref:PRC and DUF2382 domain-containing protein n=1 Tax=Amycolatopsis acididurans TaxID=2724524 RepID=A0ABX1J124_9PSEU|nr:PRC and DUF2382 domain-containing protein [Amycolatopsis acididurans]NKQ53473.1 PRC and DUF2382 domain-containing protein [Amycolatopsis acididurans]